MLFNSIEFLVFLPLVVVLYAVTPRAMRWLILLVASYYFYWFSSSYHLLLLVFSAYIPAAARTKLGR